MRRILRGDKKPDKSKEKQKQKDLLAAINRDKQTQGYVEKRIKELEAHLKERERHADALEKDIDGQHTVNIKLNKLIKKLEDSIRPLQSEKDLLERKIKSLEHSLMVMREKVNREGTKTEAEMKRLDKVRNDRHKELHDSVVAVERELARKQAELAVKTKSEEQIGKSISDMEREKKQMDTSIARRMEELAKINMDIAENKVQADKARRDLESLDNELKRVKETIDRYDDEIEEKAGLVKKAEQEAEDKRHTIVSLVRREQRLNELIPTIKDLYAKAGIDIDI